MNSGLFDPASRSARMIVPGIAPMYVRRWPRISASSRMPPTLMRSNSRPRARDRASERRLADAGRSDEAQDAAGRVGLQAADGEELEDAVLDLLDVVVVVVEHLARVLEVEVVFSRRLPRQRRDPLEVRPDDAVLGRLGRQRLEPLELAVDLPAHVVRQRNRVELTTELAGFLRRLVELAELLADRLELLAQDVLALALVELGLHLALDLRADRDDLELAREDLHERAQALDHVGLLEQALLLVGLQP